MKRIAILVLLVSYYTTNSQNLEKRLASEVEFISWIGSDESEIINYTLNGHHLLTPRAKGYKTFINQWLKNHPKAMLIPIASVLVGTPGEKNSLMVNSWIVDGNQNLNIILVEKGYFSLEGVIRFETWNEISKIDRRENPKYEDMEIEILIGEKDYLKFISKAKKAEKRAKKKKLGIWSENE